MNTRALQRLTYLAVLPLCTLIIMAAARAAEPPATPTAPDVPASVAPAPEDAEGGTDWQDRFDRHDRSGWNSRHGRHARRDNGSEVVNIGDDSNLRRGETADSVVSVFGSSSSDGEAGDVVSVLGDTRVTGTVSDNAVAVLGSTYVDGKVHGDAVAVLGNMELGPHAEIDGNVVAIGGALQRDPAAIVHGSVQNIFGSFGNVGWLRAWVHHCLLYGRPLALAHGLGWAWGLAFTFLALYAVLALLFREGLTRCVQTFETQPGRAVLAALIAMLLTPVLVVLLCVTVIGIPAVPFIVFGLFCAGLFGKAVMLAWLGRRLTGNRGDGPTSHPAVAVLIGGALVLVLYLVPVLGFLVYKLLGLLGLGAVVYTVILAARAHQAAKEGPRGPAAAYAPQAASAIHATPMSGATSAGANPPAGEASVSSAAAAAHPQGPAPAAEAPQAQAQAAQAPTQAPPTITAALPRAGFWIRMAALLLDALLVGFLMGVLHHLYHLELLVLAAYGAVMWKLRGSTIGGIVFDLQVVRLDGREIGWETAIVRALGCFLSLAVAGLGFIWIAFDDHKQAWHDKIAGTVVVRVAKGAPLV
ncbi:MAG TPA: RDD family protein [Steroidobacteraceae bacterium]|jgi:uncharacterized RDD family membrane protein YckC